METEYVWVLSYTMHSFGSRPVFGLAVFKSYEAAEKYARTITAIRLSAGFIEWGDHTYTCNGHGYKDVQVSATIERQLIHD
jgi:hypothetical protein